MSSFCLLDLQTSAPVPNEMAPLVWRLLPQSGCTAYDAQAAQVIGADNVFVVEAAVDVFQEVLELGQVLVCALGDAR